VQNKRITYDITVSEGVTGVTFERCEFDANGFFGINGSGAVGMIVTDCTFIGPGTSSTMAAAVLGAGTFTRLNVYGVSLGLNLQGQSTVSRCYIHDLGYGSVDPHYDGIMVQGGNFSTLIEHNHVTTPGTGGTAGILVTSDFGSISGVTVNHNASSATHLIRYTQPAVVS
jgi:hypothetical protein